MAGGDVKFPGTIPDHISTFFGLTFVHLGDVYRKGPEIRDVSNKHISDNGALCKL